MRIVLLTATLETHRSRYKIAFIEDHDHFLRFNLLPMNNLLSKGLVFSQGELWKK
jgi:hypothetical protein